MVRASLPLLVLIAALWHQCIIVAYQKGASSGTHPNNRLVLLKNNRQRCISLLQAKGADVSPVEGRTDLSAAKKKKDDSSAGVTMTRRSSKLNIDIRTEREKTGLLYKDKYGEYDVPLLKTPMWFKLTVRKNSELKLADYFISIRDGTTDDSSNDKFKNAIIDSFCPVQPVLKFKGKQLAYGYKPMLPGLIFVKCIMNPDVADYIESIRGVSGLGKNRHGFSVPADVETGLELEAQKARSTKTPTAAQLLITKGEYIEVLDGQFEGRNGIVQGVDQGKLSVLLRSESDVDTLMSFELRDVKYLPNPPNDVNKMTVKDAVESLLAKNPKHPMLNALRKDGHLEAILYPERAAEEKDSYSWRERDESDLQSRGSGRRIRSIAKDDSGRDSRESSRDKFTSNKDFSRGIGGGGSADDFDEFFSDPSFSKKTGSSSSSKDGASSSFDDFVSSYLDELDSKGPLGGSGSSNKRSPVRGKAPVFNEANDDPSSLDDLLLDVVGGPTSSVGLGNRGSSDTGVPRMEDFATFELYLKALVDFEQGKDSSKKSTKWDSTKFSGGAVKAPGGGWDDDLEDLLLESTMGGGPKAAPSSKLTAPVAAVNKVIATRASSTGSREGSTIKDLKQQLRERGLPVSGSKAELTARLDASG